MPKQNYILMKFQGVKKLQAHYFCANDEQDISKKIIHHLIQNDVIFKKKFISNGYSLEVGGLNGYADKLYQILNDINWSDDDIENVKYKLFELDILTNESELKELELWNQKPVVNNQGKYRNLSHLTQNGEFIEIITQWNEKIDVSSFNFSALDSDRNWVNEIPRLKSLERARFKESLVSKKHAAITVGIYFQNNKPVYICRRSSISIYYEWLIKLNDFCQEHYENRKKLLSKTKQQPLDVLTKKDIQKYRKEAESLRKEENALLAIEKARQAFENSKRNAAQKKAHDEKMNNLNHAIAIEREAQVAVFRLKLEKEKRAIQEYYDAFIVHQNEWLCGISNRAKNNKLAWEMAEKEEEKYQKDRLNFNLIIKTIDNTEGSIK
jgi:hypothetical protein